ncbi:MAG TPA: MFS transporter [Chloroflexota bacterium]|nr:MFS transporter [Chloroflexota bacterium]
MRADPSAAAPAPGAVRPAAPAGGGSRLAATFRALRNRNYRLFWSGQLVSLTGSWIQRTAMAWLVLQLTDSPLALGTVTMLQFLPLLLFALLGGVLADRLPKRRLLLVTQVGTAAQAALLAALVGSGAVQLWHLYLFSLVQGLFQAVDNPTRNAFAMELVGPEDLANAVALNSGNFNLSRIVGPATGGLLLATVGTAACFWLNALSYFPVIAGLLLMRPAEFHAVPPPARGPLGRQLLEGLAYAVRTPSIFGVLFVTWALGAFGFNFLTVLPLLARYAFDAGPEGYGFLSSCLGLGSLAAALAVAGRRRATRRQMLVAAAGFSLLLGLIALSPWYAATAALLVLLGGAGIAFSATAQTLLQYAAPGPLRGRVMSLYTLLFAGMTPLGALTVGGLSETLDVRSALGLLGVLCALGTAVTWGYLRHRLGRQALADV